MVESQSAENLSSLEKLQSAGCGESRAEKRRHYTRDRSWCKIEQQDATESTHGGVLELLLRSPDKESQNNNPRIA